MGAENPWGYINRVYFPFIRPPWMVEVLEMQEQFPVNRVYFPFIRPPWICTWARIVPDNPFAFPPSLEVKCLCREAHGRARAAGGSTGNAGFEYGCSYVVKPKDGRKRLNFQ